MECFSEVHSNGKVWENVVHGTRAVRHIGITLFNGFALQEVVAIGQAFQSANALCESTRHGTALYNVCLLSATGGMIASSSSVFVWTENIDACRHTDNFHALFIVGGAGARSALRDEHLIRWLRRSVPRSQLTFPITEGRLLLEAAALGQAGTDDAWGNRADSLAAKHLDAAHYANAVGPLRAALNVIREDLGTDITRKIASGVATLVETEFTSIVSRNAAPNVSERIQASARWLAANSDRQITIDEAAQVCAMSERNFLRRFKTELGVTPSDYLMYVRLDMCCRLLVETDLPVDKIALRCGISGGGRVSKLFRRYLAMTPTAYRMRNRASTRQTRVSPVARAAP
ncbi:AraC family transcriptional regulator [Paraburkholderia phytofirmans OLGA172]|uniref:AraC family transcriptional regulator n=1 Tax=Paraburkholderia phytofirmans OLGA172 TaxID=1417228 RepID=A0A160FRZ3_9BURK|nr:helix-turn-helix domain-containing protein [Paraburkholderia phytofirmans]ANB75631.1 AraC family transcriptional regulator [Paraburkholderia phytofirmans OLGA172]